MNLKQAISTPTLFRSPEADVAENADDADVADVAEDADDADTMDCVLYAVYDEADEMEVSEAVAWTYMPEYAQEAEVEELEDAAEYVRPR